MAIDTANKRASCIGLGGMPWRLRPIPDGSLDTAADRAHLAFLYAGIALGEPAEESPPATENTWRAVARPATWVGPRRPDTWTARR